MNDVFYRQSNIDSDGRLREFQPAQEMGMCCEIDGCDTTIGKDYKRNIEDVSPGWEDEPIFLCLTHSKGHEPFPPPIKA